MKQCTIDALISHEAKGPFILFHPNVLILDFIKSIALSVCFRIRNLEGWKGITHNSSPNQTDVGCSWLKSNNQVKPVSGSNNSVLTHGD